MGGFALDLKAYAEKGKAGLEKTARTAIMDIGNRLVSRTPVGDATLWKHKPPAGYAGGRARANWQHGFNVPASGEVDAIDPTGSVSNENISAHVMQADAAGIHYLTNNVPYAMALEEGHSTQAPNGMVELTRIEWQDIVDEAVGKTKGGA